MSVAYDDEGLKAQQIPKPPPGSPHPDLGDYYKKNKDHLAAVCIEMKDRMNRVRTIDEIAEDRERVRVLDELYPPPDVLGPKWWDVAGKYYNNSARPRTRWPEALAKLGFIFAVLVAVVGGIYALLYELPEPTMVQPEPPAPLAVVQSTLDVYKSDNFIGPMLEPGVDFTIGDPIEVGAYGVLENGEIYENARLPARPAEVDTYRITCYGPPMFPLDGDLARWPLKVADGLALAESMGLDGICAVSPDTPWYDAVTSDRLVVLHVEDHGEFLVIDRMAQRIRNGVDLYNPYLSSTNQWSHHKEVWEVQDDDEM